MGNVFANDVIPGPQVALRDISLAQTGLNPGTTTETDTLPLTVATFKTLGCATWASPRPRCTGAASRRRDAGIISGP